MHDGVHEWVHGMVGDVHEEDHRGCDVKVLDGGKEQGKDGIVRDRQVRILVSNHVWHLE